LKWLFRLGLAAAVLVVVLALSSDTIARLVMEHRLRAQTGMDAEIGRVNVGWWEPRLEIRDLKIFNSKEFGGTPFLDIPEIHVEYDRPALARRQLHLTLARFNLAELDIVKNEAGRTNIFSAGMVLPALQGTAHPATGTSTQEGAASAAEFERQTGLSFPTIDALNVSIGTLKYIDLKDQRNNRTQKIGLENMVVKNVASPKDLVGLAGAIGLRGGDFFTALLGLQDDHGGGFWKRVF
jgi:hypothetical protein